MNDLGKRTVTAVFLVPATILAVLYLDTPYFALTLAVVCLLGLFEWCRLIGWRQYPLRLSIAVLLALLFTALWLLHSTDLAQLLLLVGVFWWPIAALWLRHYSFAEQSTLSNQMLKLLGGVLTVIPAWMAAVVLHASGANGPLWVLFVLSLVWCADIFAYFVGRRLGGTKLAPRISPGKTLAGVWGGLAGCALYALIAAYALNLQNNLTIGLILLSLITVIFSIVGDLFESLIKRHTNHKDSGRILPGHGGVFDRLDSLFAALPIFVTGKQLLGL
jgi:phosphatidate cytidylyltransferase